MPDEQQRPTFWTTLPGIMTATASLITALVGMLALFMSRGGDVPSRPPAADTSAAAATVLTNDPPQDAAACQNIAGEWVWSTGGVVTIGTDGGLQWRAHASDAVPTVTGRWLCTDSGSREYLFTWSHGFSDVFALSEDGQRVSGTNQQTQLRLFGNRQK